MKFSVACRWTCFCLLLLCCLLGGSFLTSGSAQITEREDLRVDNLRDPDHFSWRPPEELSLPRWEERRKDLRHKLLVATGLWPPPPRTPLNAKIFGETEGDGFRVAKVYFESLPGFLVTGNLYRPAEGEGPFPALLNLHGHWRHGRLENSEQGSVIGRCLDFARQGYVVLSVDMIGYLDSFQLPHESDKICIDLSADREVPSDPRMFRGGFDFPRERLYGLSLAGLQLWNNLRAIDFLAGLPEVDASRLGVTGASGGATQTLLVTAADDRVTVAAPVNILGSEKHPGCQCENPPGLWISTSTLELAAGIAPRPLILVSAREDPWTHSTPTREYPYLKRYWELFGAGERLTNVHVDAGHNYNAESRAAVYQWFRRYLNPPGEVPVDIQDVAPEPRHLGDLRVFPDKLLPDEALPAEKILENWREMCERLLADRWPKTPTELRDFQEGFRRAVAHLFNAQAPAPEAIEYAVQVEEKRGDWLYRSDRIGRRNHDDWIELESLRLQNDPEGAVLLVYPEAFGPLSEEGSQRPMLPFLRSLADRGWEIFRVRGFASGQLQHDLCRWARLRLPAAYNPDDRMLGVQDVLTALAAVRAAYPEEPLRVIGLGRAGLITWWASALFPSAIHTVVDLDHQSIRCDEGLLRNFPLPGIRRVGDFRTAALLVFPGSLTLLNPAPGETFDDYQELADHVGAGQRFRVEPAAPLADVNFQRLLN